MTTDTALSRARGVVDAMTPGEYRAVNSRDMDSDPHPELVHVWAYTPEVLRPGQSSIWPGGLQGTEVASCEESNDPEANAAGIVFCTSFTRAALSEAAVEELARVIDPSSWRVFDGYLADVKRKYRGKNAGYDPEAFKDKKSMALVRAVLTRLAEMAEEAK